MGDRCFIRIEFAKRDKEMFTSVFEKKQYGYLEPQETAHNGIMEVEEDEINYGGDDLLKALMDAGLTFNGYHSDGSAYDGEVFTCICGDIISHCTTKHGDIYVIPTCNHEVPKETKERLKKYYHYEAEFKRYTSLDPRHDKLVKKLSEQTLRLFAEWRMTK